MKYFGTDGFRGEANVGLTVEHAYKIGRFVGWYYGANRGAKARVIVGKDTRRSSYMFEAALVSGLVASGADAYMLHVIPTPGVAHQTVEGCFDCGIMISASHNPFCDNGIKLVNSDGFKMDEDVLELIEDYIDGKSEVPLATGNHIGATVDYMQGRNRYIASLIVSANFSLQGVKIGIDCANGSASSVAKPVFDALGADVRVINAAPDGFNINVDCGSTHMERLQRHVVEQGLDVGFAYDGDADRCLAVDERGRVVDGDQILYVCGVYLNKHGRLSGGTVVPTIASNFGLIKSLELAGLSAVTSGVGDRHVYAKMREGGYSLGGEQTGHTIFGDIERTGDGIMTSLRVMEVIRAERETLSQLTAPCKLLPQAQVAVRVADKDAALENMGVQNAIAEAEVALAGEGRVLVRKSGTESVIRVLAEAPDQASADAAMKRIAAALEALKVVVGDVLKQLGGKGTPRIGSAASPLRWRVGYALQLVERGELVLQVAAVVAGIERHAAGALDEFQRVFGAAPLPNVLAQPGTDGRQIAARAGAGKVDAVAAHGRHKHGVVGAAQRIGGEVAKRAAAPVRIL